MAATPHDANQFPQATPREELADFSILNPNWQVVEHVRQTVLDSLSAHNIDPTTVCLAGFDPQRDKTTGDEPPVTTGSYHFFFGTVASMAPPSPEDDTELAGEKWVVNPLHYALRPGNLLGVFDLKQLEPLILEHDEEFGTYTALATPEQVNATRVATLNLF